MSAESLVRSFYEDLWNRWDDSLVPSILSPGFAFRGSLGTSTVGHDGWRSYRDTVRAGSVRAVCGGLLSPGGCDPPHCRWQERALVRTE